MRREQGAKSGAALKDTECKGRETDAARTRGTEAKRGTEKA